jgi:hypothetical protein
VARPRLVVDLPGDGPGLAALVRDLAPEIAIVARKGGSVLAAGEDYSLVFTRTGDSWTYRARPPLGYPLAHHGEVTDEDHLATLLGPVLGLDAETVRAADEPASYLRHRALVTSGDPDVKSREAELEADHRRSAIKAVDDGEGDDDE